MKSRLSSFRRSAAIALASAAFVGAFALTATGAKGPLFSDPVPQPQVEDETLAELAFPDAPYGVDSMVTGPTSKAFAAQQERLGCAEAKWPNIPVGCYPN